MSKRRSKQKMCTSKQRHETQEDAEVAARSAMMRYRDGAPIGVYRCRICGGWHVGHRVK